jgi:hypothetical protein
MSTEADSTDKMAAIYPNCWWRRGGSADRDFF